MNLIFIISLKLFDLGINKNLNFFIYLNLLKFFQSFFFLIIGAILGVGAIWPGIITETGRKCFLKVIKDGSDGNVSLGTIFSITPNYLLKINNAKNIELFF